MKKLFAVFMALSNALFALSQNVGIGVQDPAKKLSVNGTIVVDYNDRNQGDLDSASLLFGSKSASVGLTSGRNPFQPDLNGLNFWTNKQKRITILENGNVGIGSTDPLYKLHVNGSFAAVGNSVFNGNASFSQHVGIGGSYNGAYALIIQEGNSYFADNVYIGGAATGGERLHVRSEPGVTSARFEGGNVMIGQGASIGTNLDVGNNIFAGNNLRVNGFAGVGGAPDGTYRMRVYGNLRVDDNLGVQGRLASGGLVDNTYQMRIYGNARIDDNFRVETRAAIGGAVDDNFRLRVYNGNSRFGGDVEVTGTLNAANLDISNLSIGGSGAVRSNGSSQLKIHFFEVNVDAFFTYNGQTIVYDIGLPDFDDVADVRVFISHFQPSLEVGANQERIIASIFEVDAASNICKLAMKSTSSQEYVLGGTYYLMAVMKDN